MNNFAELITVLVSEIEGIETRQKRRASDVQERLSNGTSAIIEDTWKALQSIPAQICTIHLGRSYYSHTNRYADRNLSYRTIKAAYDGLQKLGYIEETQKGFYDPVKMQGKLTQYKPTDKLVKLIAELDGHPAIYFLPNLDQETVLLRQKTNKHKELIDYVDTELTKRHRSKLTEINKCLLRHWLDIELP